MRTATAVQLAAPEVVGRLAYRVAAGIQDDENPILSGVEILRPVSVDVSAKDLGLSEQLVTYLNVLAEAELELVDEDGMKIGKRQSRRSVLKDALHAGLALRLKAITSVLNEPLPSAKDLKAMKVYAARTLAKAKHI